MVPLGEADSEFLLSHHAATLRKHYPKAVGTGLYGIAVEVEVSIEDGQAAAFDKSSPSRRRPFARLPGTDGSERA